MEIERQFAPSEQVDNLIERNKGRWIKVKDANGKIIGYSPHHQDWLVSPADFLGHAHRFDDSDLPEPFLDYRQD